MKQQTVKLMCLTSLVLLLSFSFFNCSNKEQYPEEKTWMPLKSSLTSQEFHDVVKRVSNKMQLPKNRTALADEDGDRLVELSEEEAREILLPLINDGQVLQAQLLSGDDLTIQERDSIENFSEGKLAIVSFLYHTLSEGVRNEVQASCMTSALLDGIGVSGVLRWSVRKIVLVVTVRGLCAGSGGLIGAVFLRHW